MAGDLHGFALEKAELLSGRLKELLSSGQGYLRAQFGLDLGLKPELYPTWVILSSAAAGLLLLLLGLSWGLLPGKRRRCPDTASSAEPEPEPEAAPAARAARPAEEQKKRNKKKAAEKKPQSNGQPAVAAQEEVKVIESAPKTAPPIKPEKVPEVQAPVQAKKNKKKAKPDVKPAQLVVTHDGKEPDEGAWETKVSNREKKQQRRKDKGPEDSGSPGGLMTLKPNAEATVAKTATSNKKSRGNHESLHARATGHGDAASGSVSSNWREDPPVNGGGGAEVSMKMAPQIAAGEGNKWSNIHPAPHYRAPPKRQSWAQDAQAWSGMDGLSPGPFSMLGRNATDPIANSMDMQWGGHQEVDDEWSGFNGMAAADPSSDWNAPVEHWGNYEEPPVLAAPAPPPKEQPAPSKVSDDEKDAEDPSGGAGKSKKKRKKKKKTEEEAQAAAAPQELPVQASKKQNPSISSAQKKPEQTAEPPKPSQKKKVRRET